MARNTNDVKDVGNLNDYDKMALYDLKPESKAFDQKLLETFNILPGSHDDVNYFGYLQTQFNWGKKVVTFYRHPEDDFRSARATKNIMGQ